MDQLLVGRHEAAAALGISLRSLDYNIARGELPVRRIGRRVLITRQELETFANSRETTNEAPNNGRSK